MNAATTTNTKVYSLPGYSKAVLEAGQLYLLKTNPHDADDIAIHSPQLLSNNIPDNCQMIEAVGERTYIYSSVTAETLPEYRAQRGHAPSFNQRHSAVANPLRPLRRQVADTADIIDSEFEAPPDTPQDNYLTEEQKAAQAEEARLLAELEEEKRKSAQLKLQQQQQQQQQQANKKQKPKNRDQKSLDGIEFADK